MPNLVPSYNTKRVFGTWVRQGGTEMRPGNYKVTVPVRVTNATDDVIIPAGIYSTGVLNTAPGTTAPWVPSLDILVPCTNDPDNFPSGWQVYIEIIFPDAPGEKYVLDVDIAGTEINLRTVILAETLPVPESVLITDIPGGLATLDDEGKLKETQIPDGIGGGASTVDELTDASDLGKDIVQSVSASETRTLISAASTDAATTTGSGLVELATATETTTGTDTARAVTPAGLASTLAATTASTTAQGLVELATSTEATTGTDTARAVTPAGLTAKLAATTASATAIGLVELATSAEVATGTDTTRAVTPAGLAALTASATAPGLVELATTTEATTGTDTARAVTPAGLAASAALRLPLTVSRPVIRATASNTWPTKVSYGLTGYTGTWEYDHSPFGAINDAALPADATDDDIITDEFP